MDDLFTLPLQRPCFVENFKCSFCAQARHALRQAELVLNGFLHGENRNYTPLVRTQGTGGSAVKPSGAGQLNLLRAVRCVPSKSWGCPANKHQTDPIRELLS